MVILVLPEVHVRQQLLAELHALVRQEQLRPAAAELAEIVVQDLVLALVLVFQAGPEKLYSPGVDYAYL
jgi:hypothetical protein